MFQLGAIALLFSLLMEGAVAQARLDVAGSPPPIHFSFNQLGIAVFDLKIDGEGNRVSPVLLRGEPPFVAPSRLALQDWQFSSPAGQSAHSNVTFIYRPRRDLPDSASSITMPPPSGARISAPFPIQIVDPGYPLDAMDEGEVILELGLRANGTIGKVRVVQGLSRLTVSALAAARDWRFFMPSELDPSSRTAIVAIWFQRPRWPGTGATTPSTSAVQARLVRGEVPALSGNGSGTLRADDPVELTFEYSGGHWPVPYNSITGIEVDPASSVVTISYQGLEGDAQKVAFELGQADVTALAARLSERTGLYVEFAGAGAAIRNRR